MKFTRGLICQPPFTWRSRYSRERGRHGAEAAKETGFTLIELLIAVAIIGVLAAIAIPQFSSYRAKSYDSAAQGDLRNLKTQMESNLADNNGYPGGL